MSLVNFFVLPTNAAGTGANLFLDPAAVTAITPCPSALDDTCIVCAGGLRHQVAFDAVTTAILIDAERERRARGLPDWPDAFEEFAQGDGWTLCDFDSLGLLEIERLDADPKNTLAADAEAQEHVRRLVEGKTGGDYHRLAWRLHEFYAPYLRHLRAVRAQKTLAERRHAL